jgi:hypothetical protein
LVANRASTEVIDVFIDLNKGTVYLSSVLFPFFCMYIVLPFSPFLLLFWKGKGAFILGCTSPLKAIMIDRPGMGKVKN